MAYCPQNYRYSIRIEFFVCLNQVRNQHRWESKTIACAVESIGTNFHILSAIHPRDYHIP